MNLIERMRQVYLGNKQSPSTLRDKFILFSVGEFFYLICAFLFMLYGRWFSIVYPLPLHPEEALSIANTFRMQDVGIGWDILERATAGPLNVLFLSWPKLLGWDVTFSTARLTGLFLGWGSIVFTFLTIKKLTRSLYALLFTLPLVLFYACVKTPIFLHYNPILLSLFILTVSNYLVVSIVFFVIQERSGWPWFVLLGCLGGIIPFIKLNGSLIAICIWIYGFYLASLVSFHRSSRLTALILGTLIPGMFFLVPLFFTNLFVEFWLSLARGSEGYFSDILSFKLFSRLLIVDVVFRAVMAFLFLFPIVFLLFPKRLFLSTESKNVKGVNKIEESTQLGLNKSNESVNENLKKYNLMYLSVLLLATIFSIVLPGKEHEYYLILLPTFFTLWAASLLTFQVYTIAKKAVLVSFGITLVLVWGLSIAWGDGLGEHFQTSRNVYKTAFPQPFQTKNEKLLAWMPTKPTHMLLWNGTPQTYILYGLMPATRETSIPMLKEDLDLKNYYKAKFLFDLSKSKPEIVVDGVKDFMFTKPNKRLANNFFEFTDLLGVDYYQLQPLASYEFCPKIYVNAVTKEWIDAKFVMPRATIPTGDASQAGNAFPPEHLFDMSMSEDSCIDYWLLPDKRLGGVQIPFLQAEVISEVMILNTRNGYTPYMYGMPYRNSLDRSTKTVLISGHRANQVVFERKVQVKPYPEWTRVRFSRPVDVDEINIDILSFEGRGGGLNEVKIIRAD